MSDNIDFSNLFLFEETVISALGLLLNTKDLDLDSCEFVIERVAEEMKAKVQAKKEEEEEVLPIEDGAADNEEEEEGLVEDDAANSEDGAANSEDEDGNDEPARQQIDSEAHFQDRTEPQPAGGIGEALGEAFNGN